MAAKEQAKEKDDLSMEEILQSIRKIISDDDKEETPAEDDANKADDTMQDEEVEASGSDVLELTEMMEMEEEQPAEAVDVLQEIDNALDEGETSEEAAEEFSIDDIMAADDTEEPAEEVAEEPAPKPTPKAAAPVALADDESRLLSDDAATASAASLKKVLDTHRASLPGFRSGVTIEDLVLESMKPMLKEWLDANLPSMVERIVEREIRKLVD